MYGTKQTQMPMIWRAGKPEKPSKNYSCTQYDKDEKYKKRSLHHLKRWNALPSGRDFNDLQVFSY